MRRHAILLSALGAVAAAGAGVAVAARAPERPASLHAAPAAATAKPEPRYLPPGVTKRTDLTDPTGLRTVVYAVGDGGGDVAVQFLARPGDYVEVPPADDLFATEHVTVEGRSYTLSYPRRGLGIFRVDWTDGTTAYTMLAPRRPGPGGPAGLDYAELKRMATSVA